ncbi:MAG: hypothetical protein GYA21_11135 [Myxococcales bacterium]|nr:hypothetical protein [Myxococcales bacterium]
MSGPPREARAPSWRVAALAGLLAGAVTGGALVHLAHVLLSLPRQIEQREVVPRALGRFDERLGWSLKPGAVAVSSATGCPVEYRINSRGFRGPEVEIPKPQGVFRILLLGDSRTFGYGVPLEKHFSSVLQGYFRATEVVNLGVSGYGVDQSLLALRQDGFAYQPDLVVLYLSHFGGNRHMHANRFGGGKPRFVLAPDGALVLENSPVGSGPPADDPFAERSDDENDADPAFRQARAKLAERILAAMAEECRAHGAAFVLVSEIGEMIDWALLSDLPVLDARAPLANPAFPLSAALGHLNEAGNGALGLWLSEFLKQERLIPESHWPPPPPDGADPVRAGAP